MLDFRVIFRLLYWYFYTYFTMMKTLLTICSLSDLPWWSPDWSLTNQTSKVAANNHMTKNPKTVCWVRKPPGSRQCTSKHNLCWRQTSGGFSPVLYILMLLHHRKKYGTAKSEPAAGMEVIPNQTPEEFTFGPEFGPDVFLLSGCLAPLGKSWFGFVEWHPTHDTTAGITPYMSVCHPVSTIRTTERPLHPDGARIDLSSQSSVALGSL